MGADKFEQAVQTIRGLEGLSSDELLDLYKLFYSLLTISFTLGINKPPLATAILEGQAGGI